MVGTAITCHYYHVNSNVAVVVPFLCHLRCIYVAFFAMSCIAWHTHLSTSRTSCRICQHVRIPTLIRTEHIWRGVCLSIYGGGGGGGNDLSSIIYRNHMYVPVCV